MSPLHVTTPRGWRAAVATALCALATLASLHALTNLLGTVPWRGAVTVQVLVVAASVMIVRALTRSVWAPSVVGLVVAFVAVLLRYGAPPGRLQLVPDLSSWERTAAMWSEGVHVVQVATVPVDVVRPLELMLAVGALLVFLAADLLAVGLGMPALAGVAFAAMWTPTIVLGFPARGSALFWTGLLYLLLLALSVAPRGTRDDDARRAGLAGASAAGVLVVALVAGPVLAGLPGWSSWGLPQFGSGRGGPVDLTSDLDVRESLGSRTDDVVLRYQVRSLDEAADDERRDDESGQAEEPADPATPAPSATAGAAPAVNASSVGPLRAFTLLSFDGRSWHSDSPSEQAVDVGDADGLLTSDPALLGSAPDPSRGTIAIVDATVGVLEDRQLPISTFPRTLDVEGDWSYDVSRDQVDGAEETFEGMEFSMTVEIPSLTADELEDAQVATTGDPRALEVPASSHEADIRALAAQVAQDAGATTPYERALALQTFLRSSANFTYDTHVAPARTDDPVWDFLESRQGYCVQFATAMTVMARSLGLPARVGVGFLPGSATGGSYVVTGQQSHAWPEIAFEGYGWVRFEPTPAVQTGAPPPWSDPFANTGGGAFPTGDVIPTGAPVTGGTAPVNNGPGTVTTTEETTWVPVAITVAVVLVIAALVVTALTRRRARVLADLTPEQAWVRLRRGLARLGVRWTPATTPRAVVPVVVRQVEHAAGGPLDDESVEALRSLARAVEQERYALHAVAPEPGATARWADQVITGARGAGVARQSRFSQARHAVRGLVHRNSRSSVRR